MTRMSRHTRENRKQEMGGLTPWRGQKYKNDQNNIQGLFTHNQLLICIKITRSRFLFLPVISQFATCPWLTHTSTLRS